MVKIAIDAGYGLTSLAKRSFNNDNESNYNEVVVRAVIDKLKTYKDVQIFRVDDPSRKISGSPKGNTDKVLKWNADVYVTIHHNVNIKSKEITAILHPRIIRVGEQEGKQVNFHVLREPTMPAILTEKGSIDSVVDIIKLSGEKYLVAEGEAIADGLAACIQLQPCASSLLVLKEKEKLYKPNSQELIKATMIVLQYLESSRQGVVPEKWLNKIQEGTLNDSDSIGLLYVVLHHWLSD